MAAFYTRSARRVATLHVGTCCLVGLFIVLSAGQATATVIPPAGLASSLSGEANKARWQSSTDVDLIDVLSEVIHALVDGDPLLVDATSLRSSKIIWDASADAPESWNYSSHDPGPEVASTTERSGRPWMTERVTDVVAEGTHASRFETRGTDYGAYESGACHCERAEIAMGNPSRPGYDTITADGTIRYYGFMVYVPTSTAYARWQVVFQSKSNAPAGSPENSLIVRDDQFQLDNNDEPSTPIATVPIAPARKGVWHRFVLGIKYHPSYSVGFQKVWHAEGFTAPMILKVDRTTHTKEAGKDNHVRWGNYHSPQSGTSVVYHDGMRAGTSPQAVAYGPVQ